MEEKTKEDGTGEEKDKETTEEEEEVVEVKMEVDGEVMEIEEVTNTDGSAEAGDTVQETTEDMDDSEPIEIIEPLPRKIGELNEYSAFDIPVGAMEGALCSILWGHSNLIQFSTVQLVKRCTRIFISLLGFTS